MRLREIATFCIQYTGQRTVTSIIWREDWDNSVPNGLIPTVPNTIVKHYIRDPLE